VKVQFNNSICQVLTSTPTSITVVTSGLQGNMTAGTPHTLQLAPSQVCCHEHSQCALQSPLLVTVRALRSTGLVRVQLRARYTACIGLAIPVAQRC
jgi:hypothetical protein